ncbi:MAG: phosphatase PAP2 family protein [Chlorobiales bacterium]|nr:phosphatase PAP2 family protein [Chlorobiales bacterium]
MKSTGILFSYSIVIVFLLFPLPGGTSAAQAGSRSTGDILQDDAEHFARDFRDIFSAPARFDASDWITLGAVAGSAAAAALWADEPVREYMLDNRSVFTDDLVSVGDFYGKLSTGYYLGSALYVTGIVSGDDWIRYTGRAVLEAHTFSLLITGVIKAVSGRSRPYRFEGNRQFSWFETENSRWSFPSGHATASFAISSALSRRIDNPWATAGLYALSGVTVLDRIYDDKHWLSDTIVGAAIGTAVGLAIGDMINEEEAERKKGGLEALNERPVELLRFSKSF